MDGGSVSCGHWLHVHHAEIQRCVLTLQQTFPHLTCRIFQGTAIFVFFIIPNFAANSNLASEVRCSFFIDGTQVGSFTHDSDGSSVFAYNTLVYSNVTVPSGDHVLLIETTGADPAIIIFDYALYTYVPPHAGHSIS